MGMFSFLKAPEHISTALKAVINTGDALAYTAEEQAEMRKELATIHLDHIKATHGENSETSVARRWLAMLIVTPFVFLTIGSALLKFIGALFKPALVDGNLQAHYYQTALFETAKHWRELASTEYAVLVGMVAVFYFGNHIVKGLKK